MMFNFIRRGIISLFLFVSFFIHPAYADPLSSQLEIEAFLEEFTIMQWGSLFVGLYIHPENIGEEENYFCPIPITLTCNSSNPGGWFVYLGSEEVDLEGNFLLRSEDNQHFLRFILISEKVMPTSGNIKTLAIKNGDKVIEVSSFISGSVSKELYVAILKGQLMQVPAGYYHCTIKSFLIS